MILSSVVLPQPEGPRKVTSLPRSTVSAMFESAVNLPKRLVTPVSFRKESSEEGAVTTQPNVLRAPPSAAAHATNSLFLRRRLGVVALGPLGENLVAVLRFPGEIV